jgi:hypothetical protein
MDSTVPAALLKLKDRLEALASRVMTFFVSRKRAGTGD